MCIDAISLRVLGVDENAPNYFIISMRYVKRELFSDCICLHCSFNVRWELLQAKMVRQRINAAILLTLISIYTGVEMEMHLPKSFDTFAS